MAKLTSGPWEAENCAVFDVEENVVAECFDIYRSREECEANANFIALARTILEQVEWVCGMYENCAPYCPWCDEIDLNGHAPDCIRQRALGEEIIADIEPIAVDRAETECCWCGNYRNEGHRVDCPRPVRLGW